MARTIVGVNPGANGDNWGALVALANTIANSISSEVVTANLSSNGALTTGNAFVSGIFGASVIVAPNIRGGTVAANGIINVSANLVVNAFAKIVCGNTTINTTMITVDSMVANSVAFSFMSLSSINLGNNTNIADLSNTTVGVSLQVIDTFSILTYRSADYFVSIKDNNSNAYQISNVLIVHDGTTAYMSEYGTVSSNGSIGAFSAAANSTAVLLQYTPVSSSSVTLHMARTTMRV